MNVRWMLAACAFSMLVTLAGVAAAHLLALSRRPTRFVWLSALGIALAWPLFAFVGMSSVAPDVVVASVPRASAGATLSIELLEPSVIERLAASLRAHQGKAIVVLWSLTSLVLLLRLVRGAHALRHMRQHASREVVAGQSVLVSENVGPAVLGRTASSVVLPRWMLALDESLLALVLRHEHQHCRAGDPLALWGAALACALAPWNAPLWYIARRLRLAIEIDCDGRVLCHHDDDALYSRLLILVSQHNRSMAFAPMLAHTRSQLARRIAAMHPTPVRFPLMQRAIAATMVAVALLAACSSRLANNLAGPGPLPEPPSTTTSITTTDSTHVESSTRTMPAVLAPGTNRAPSYPRSMLDTATHGAVVIQFIIDADGSVAMSTLKVLRSDEPRFLTAVRDALPVMHYLPAEVDGRKVRQLVQQRFDFQSEGRDGAKTVAIAKLEYPGATPSSRVLSNDKQPAYFDFQVDKPATMAPGATAPKYPTALRDAKVEASVLVQFVVDANGVPDIGSFKVLRTAAPEFVDAIRSALGTMKFIPAQVQGQPVRQLVQQPFQFSLSR